MQSPSFDWAAHEGSIPEPLKDVVTDPLLLTRVLCLHASYSVYMLVAASAKGTISLPTWFPSQPDLATVFDHEVVRAVSKVQVAPSGPSGRGLVDLWGKVFEMKDLQELNAFAAGESGDTKAQRSNSGDGTGDIGDPDVLANFEMDPPTPQAPDAEASHEVARSTDAMTLGRMYEFMSTSDNPNQKWRKQCQTFAATVGLKRNLSSPFMAVLSSELRTFVLTYFLKHSKCWDHLRPAYDEQKETNHAVDQAAQVITTDPACRGCHDRSQRVDAWPNRHCGWRQFLLELFGPRPDRQPGAKPWPCYKKHGWKDGYRR
jgi:hypothetical protein